MNCKQARRFFATDPFTAHTAAEKRAVRLHAEGCADCTAVMRSTRIVEAELASLPEPVHPDLSVSMARIMARVERVEVRAEAELVARSAQKETRRVGAYRWGAIVVGLVVASLAQIYLLLTRDLADSLLSPQVDWIFGWAGAGPGTNLALLCMAAGLLLFVSGFLELDSKESEPLEPRL